MVCEHKEGSTAALLQSGKEWNAPQNSIKYHQVGMHAELAQSLHLPAP
jgi:hypothetical protein